MVITYFPSKFIFAPSLLSLPWRGSSEVIIVTMWRRITRKPLRLMGMRFDWGQGSKGQKLESWEKYRLKVTSWCRGRIYRLLLLFLFFQLLYLYGLAFGFRRKQLKCSTFFFKSVQYVDMIIMIMTMIMMMIIIIIFWLDLVALVIISIGWH